MSLQTVHYHVHSGDTVVTTTPTQYGRNGSFGVKDDEGNNVVLFAPVDPEAALVFYEAVKMAASTLILAIAQREAATEDRP